MNVIILAGGLGTRLKDVVQDVPKPMAMVAGKPFLEYILLKLKQNNLKNVILCVGYKKECIMNHFNNNFQGIDIKYSIEDKPLQTGGAIYQAMKSFNLKTAIVINGDTFFDIDYNQLINAHKQYASEITIAGKYMENFSRYGAIICDSNNTVLEFKEKQFMKKGYFNAGSYVIEDSIFSGIDKEKFSFEEDVCSKIVKDGRVYMHPFNDYFIDIGIPDDFHKANKDFKND